MGNSITRKSVFLSLVLASLLGTVMFMTLSVPANAELPVLSSLHKFDSSGTTPQNLEYHSIITELQPDEETKSTFQPPSIAGDPLSSRITSRSAVVLDAVTGEVLYARAPDLEGQPASTIKVITGMLAINTLDNREKVPVSKRAAHMPRSKIYLKAGKSYAANDLINAVLLASANDASVALAEKIGGSEAVFASLMTHKARELGAKNTVCKTANGLTAKGQKSTARDLAVMFNVIMKNPEFAERIRKIKVKTADGKILRNHNRALWEVSGAEGGKTGYTRLARQTYVGKFRRGQDELLIAIMGSETMWRDVRTLVEYGFSARAKLAATLPPAGKKFSPGIVQLERLGERNESPLLSVLADTKKVSRL